MADLIGTATIRVDMPTTAATRAIRRMATQAEGPLRNLQRRVSEVRTELGRLRGTTVGIAVDDQTRAGIASVRTAVNDLKRLGPVRIPVQINDGTRRGARTVQTTVASLQRLGPVRIDADVNVDPIATANAASALRDLQTAARGTARTLGTLATRATTATAALVALGAAARTLRGDMDDLDGSIRRTGGGMTALRGRLGTLSTGASAASDSMKGLLHTALLLSPALLPIAAQAAPIAVALTAATTAVVAFVAAAGGQISALSEASKAEKKYTDAVREHGTGSKEAGQAQIAYARTVADMPAPTRKAAAALSSLKDQYREWSDSLAGDTMPVATKSLQAFSALFPKLTPVVQGASGQLDRFVTIAMGGISSPSFDRFMQSFAEFSTGVLKKANDALIGFIANANGQKISGGINEFMDYVRANGPVVRDTFSKLGEALGNLLEGAANAGPGMLTIVNALAGLVAAVPPGAITAILQMALAIKAVSLAAAGAAAISGRVAAIGAAIAAMGAASGTATGRVARVTTAIGALSRAAKVGLAGTGIGLLVIGLAKLGSIGKTAAPDVDRLTTALGRLGSGGKVSGEAARVFGDDLENLYDKVRNITDPSFVDQVQNGFVKIFTLGQVDSTASKEAQEALDAIDDSLTSLVQGGKINEAGAALDVLAEKYSGNANEQAKFRAEMDEYNDALDAHKAELEIAARAMGAFGEQAQLTSAKLAAQKVDADGLREALIALNDVNRSAYDSEIAYEASIDALTKSFKENGATLDLNTEKGRANGQAMSAAAKARDELIANGVAAGESLDSMSGKSDRLRESMLKLAVQAFDGNKTKAQEYINTLLGTPAEVTTLIKAERTNAIAGLQAVQAEIKKTPKAKSVTVTTLNAAAIKALEDVGYKTERLPDGRTKVTTANGQAIGAIGEVSNAIRRLKGKSITVSAKDQASATAKLIRDEIARVRSKTVTITSVYNTIGLEGTAGRNRRNYGATGGLYTGLSGGFKHRGYADGGLVQGPGTETSDGVFAPWLSKNEFVVNARRTRQYLPLLRAINEGRLPTGGTNSGAVSGSGSSLAQSVVSMMRGTFSAAAEQARTMAASALPTLGRGLGRQLGPSVAEVAAAARKSAEAEQRARANKTAAKAARERASARAARSSTSGFSAAVAELQRLVDTGRWSRKGSLLFEDISFQGMSRNFTAQQMKVADGFWNAVYEIKKAVRAGKRVFEDMTYKGMSGNVSRFHDMIAQIWKGNPYGRNFGDWGNFGSYGRYGKYAAGGLVTGPGTGTSDSVPILASNREYIVNAKQTSRNLPLLQAINSGQVSTTGRRGTASAALGDTNITVVVQNHGVIGSQMQMQDWLAKSLDNLARTGRLPTSLRKAVAA